MTMRKKMLVAFTTVVVLMAALGIAGWLALNKVRHLSEDAESINEIHEVAAAIDGDLQEIGTALDSYTVGGADEAARIIAASLTHVEEEIAELEHELSIGFDITMDVPSLVADTRRLSDDITAFMAARSDAPGEAALLADLAEVQHQTHEFYEESEEWTTEAAGAQADVVSRLAAQLALAGLGLLTILAAAWVFGTRSLGRIDALTETAVAIADGDLNRHVDDEHDDEIGRLAGAFNSMTGQLRELINNLEMRVAERTAELSEANEALQQEVRDRQRAEVELERYAARLEQSNSALQEFAYVASHDLQEPLRKIQSFGSRLSSKYRDDIDERGQDYLDRMRNAAARMQDLIEGLLTYSRVTSRTNEFEPVDLNEVVAGVLSDLEVRLQESGGAVNVADLPTVDADPVQMRQLLQNLIANALKFADPGRPPEVSVAAERLEPSNGHGAEWQISVADNGIGFEQKYADRIFGVFQRLHGRGEYKGTGIGLAACAKIVERHQGSITATGKPGEGATFGVRLPALRQTQQEETMWAVPAKSTS